MNAKAYFPIKEITDLKDMLDQSSKSFNDHPAFEIKGPLDTFRKITYAQFKTEVDAFGTALVSLGLKDRFIALISENRYEWCLTYLSTVNGVGVIVPLDKELADEEIENLLIRSKAAAVIFSAKYETRMKELSSKTTGLQYFIGMDLQPDTKDEKFLSYQNLLQTGYKLLSAGERQFLDSRIDAEKLSVLLFTSGTTGVIKGVMLSHRNLCANIQAVCQRLYLEKGDRIIAILPLHHSYGSMTSFLIPFYRGMTIGFNDSIKYLAKNIKEFRPTHLTLVPLIVETVYHRILNQIESTGKTRKLKIGMLISDLLVKIGIDIRKKLFKEIHDNFGGQLRVIICGAAALDPKAAKFFRRIGITLLPGYGLTECSPVVSNNIETSINDQSVGYVLPCFEVKIDVDPNTKPVGEIVVKGPSIMLGYFEDEQETYKVLKDGWLHTGDLGYIDRKGFLFIAGRRKNVIVLKNGKNIYPEEIEDYLNRSPFIKESMIYGKEDKSSKEIVLFAQVFPDLEAFKSILKKENVSDTEVNQTIHQEIDRINKTVPFYKQVRGFLIRSQEFEKTSTQKVKRHQVITG